MKFNLVKSYFETCVCFDRMAATARASDIERLELGYESMSHFAIDTDDIAVTLMNIDFCPGMHVVQL